MTKCLSGIFKILPTIIAIWSAGLCVAKTLPEACKFFTEDQKMVSWTFLPSLEQTPHHLTTPNMYFEDPWDREDRGTHSGQLFRVRFDDFSPVTRKETAELIKSPVSLYFNFVFTDFVPLPDALDIVVWLKAQRELKQTPGFKENVSEYTQTEPAKFGLEEVTPTFGDPLFENIYISRDATGEVDTMITCNRADEWKNEYSVNPRCDHYFRSNNIDITAGYRRSRLSEWRETQQRIEDFVGCMSDD